MIWSIMVGEIRTEDYVITDKNRYLPIKLSIQEQPNNSAERTLDQKSI